MIRTGRPEAPRGSLKMPWGLILIGIGLAVALLLVKAPAPMLIAVDPVARRPAGSERVVRLRRTHGLRSGTGEARLIPV